MNITRIYSSPCQPFLDPASKKGPSLEKIGNSCPILVVILLPGFEDTNIKVQETTNRLSQNSKSLLLWYAQITWYGTHLNKFSANKKFEYLTDLV